MNQYHKFAKAIAQKRAEILFPGIESDPNALKDEYRNAVKEFERN